VTAERDLAVLLRGARPVIAHPEVVFATVPDASGVPALAAVAEDEGVSVVLRRADAERLGVGFDWVGAWITLRVHSALDAVGLTAAVTTVLADAGISCNVLAGFHHDHLLVPVDRARDALALLSSLAGPD
jgi:uncharacterized protein